MFVKTLIIIQTKQQAAAATINRAENLNWSGSSGIENGTGEKRKRKGKRNGLKRKKNKKQLPNHAKSWPKSTFSG